MYSESTAIISIGATNEHLGKIIKANLGAEALFGYQSEDLENMNINLLMPNFVR